MVRPGQIRGFTLMELMIVIGMIFTLVAISVPLYQQSLCRTKEAALRSNLFTLRISIRHFTYEQQRAPASLDELVTAGYLGQIPIDPMTNSRDTWAVEDEDPTLAADPTHPGIIDVHSGSEATALDGSKYNSW